MARSARPTALRDVRRPIRPAYALPHLRLNPRRPPGPGLYATYYRRCNSLKRRGNPGSALAVGELGGLGDLTGPRYGDTLCVRRGDVGGEAISPSDPQPGESGSSNTYRRGPCAVNAVCADVI